MALPLLWLGAAALSALTMKELGDDRKQQQRKRKQSRYAQKFSDLKEYESPIATYPTDLLTTETSVKPVIGAIVCCGLAGVLDHTGIWLGDDTIVEVDGNGLVKPVSSQRFLTERSGKQIFIACDSTGIPLALPETADNAADQLFNCIDYHLFDNNCHQFVWQCIHANNTRRSTVTTFRQLNEKMAQFYNRVIYWDLLNLH